MDTWRSPGAYWPDIVLNDPALADQGIYLFGYDTGAAPGNYSIGDATNALHEYLKLDGLLDLRQIVFVAHSMGGIIARKLAVSRQQVFTRRKTSLGFFLVASPSLGSNRPALPSSGLGFLFTRAVISIKSWYSAAQFFVEISC